MTLLAKFLPAFAVITTIALPASAESSLAGVDIVSLRDSGRAIGGKESISTEWKGRQWVFANEANRAAFESNPRAYAPAFGGHCPVALSDGKRLAGSPEYSVVVDGKLYLTGGANAQGQLKRDPKPILSRAADAWAALKR